MRKENFNHLECSLARTLDMVGEWWSLLIIRDLFYGINTFDLLCRDLSISRNILTDRLKKLNKRQLIEKFSKVKDSRRQAYRLTPKGKDLFPVIMAMVSWGDKWESPNGPPILFYHGPDRHAAKPKVICDHCGKELNARDIEPERGAVITRPDALPIPLRDMPGNGQKDHTRQ